MGVRRTSPSFFELRACLVVAALVSLCVSSNVGPRFLPLPALDGAVTALDGAAISQSELQSPPVLRQSYGKADGFRMPMMSQTQKRTEREIQQPVVLPSRDVLISPNEGRVAIERHYANSHLKPSAVSLFLGRAPPDQL